LGAQGTHTQLDQSAMLWKKRTIWRNIPKGQALPLNVTVMVDDWPVSMEVDTAMGGSNVTQASPNYFICMRESI